ncbi:hypothetical protein PANO111632_12370 [Paracoccus nototheniae]|uniref:Uncharacterized protein n=1 Tax=Paracoccus nototheniae TaxID=2489002 RepID=A0ABW4DWI8_9RHOB|nr:hypothetical protein [Paracoccus nototheniae]
MKLHTMLMTSSALVIIGTTAMADCAAELALLHAGDASAAHGGGISKDGSLAPLEMPDAAVGADSAASSMNDDPASADDSPAAGDMDAAGSTAATSDPASADRPAATGVPSSLVAPAASSEAGGEGIAKDGSLAPLEGTKAEASTPVAMSGQDIEAQQEGDPTAAESAASSPPSASAADATPTETGGTASGDYGPTAAADTASNDASAEDAVSVTSDRSALLSEAQAALDNGDEDACRAAVEKLEAL